MHNVATVNGNKWHFCFCRSIRLVHRRLQHSSANNKSRPMFFGNLKTWDKFLKNVIAAFELFRANTGWILFKTCYFGQGKRKSGSNSNQGCWVVSRWCCTLEGISSFSY